MIEETRKLEIRRTFKLEKNQKKHINVLGVKQVRKN